MYNLTVLQSQPLYYWDFNHVTTDSGGTEVSGLEFSRVKYDYGLSSTYNDNTGSRTKSSIGLGQARSSGTYGVAGNAADSITGPWGVELWFQTTDSTADTYFVMFTGNEPGLIYGFNDGHLEVYFYRNGGIRTGTNAHFLSDGAWHHLLVTNTSQTTTEGDYTFYVDGESVGSASLNNQSMASFVSTLNMTNFRVGQNVACGIDEVAIYDLNKTSVDSILAHADVPGAANALRKITGVTYKTDKAPMTNYPDSRTVAYNEFGSGKLTDGIYSNSFSTFNSSLLAEKSVGYQYTSGKTGDKLTFTFDLGDVYDLDAMMVDYLIGTKVGLGAPKLDSLRISLDGEMYQDWEDYLILSDFTQANDSGDNIFTNTFAVDLSGLQGRYLEVVLEKVNTVSSLFFSEWDFIGTRAAADVPEPSAWLLGLGLLGGMLAFRRRFQAGGGVR
ncbi:MAG: LamG-like jellyroll fold domain-containing protein [Planctomycetia bacterium]|nr:LamG-like jellyroll fold domain-containing protein [Planctomycetia bacterium]